MTLPQIITAIIVFLVISYAVRRIRSLFRFAVTIVVVLVMFGGYTWYDAVNVPIQQAKNIINGVDITPLQEHVSLDNGVLSVKLPSGEWVSADSVQLVSAEPGQDVVISVNNEPIVLPGSSGLSGALKTLENGGLLKK